MITNSASPEEKVRLFSSLFSGRGDVYALRYTSSKTGKTGYSPVCLNRWQAGICDMRNVRCAVCPHRHFAAVSDDVFHRHLLGADPSGRPFSVAVYPLGLDERTRFAIVQLDGPNWREDAKAIREAAGEMRVPCAVERAREEDSARIWFFFAEPVDGRIARDMATAVLLK